MKIRSAVLAGGLLTLMCTGVSWATSCQPGQCEDGSKPQYFSVYQDFSPSIKISKNNTLFSYTFDLDSEVAGLDPADQIFSAYLSINIDDNDRDKEYGKFYIDGSKVFSGEVDDKTYKFNVLAFLSLDHLLNVEIAWKEGSNRCGDFYVDWMKVQGTYCDVNEVPEPATMLLFGSGLAGLASYRLRKRK